MSKSINQVMLFGNVGKDPEIRQTSSGIKVASFSLATSEGGYKKADGTEVPEVTQWHNIVAWRGLAELAEKYIRKGDRIIVQGSISYRSYDNQQGQKVYVTDIIASDISLTSSKQGAQPVAQPMPQATTQDNLPF